MHDRILHSNDVDTLKFQDTLKETMVPVVAGLQPHNEVFSLHIRCAREQCCIALACAEPMP